MEREYTFGGLMVLVVIFVIALIVLVNYPGITDEVKKIADEVFGITKGALEATKRAYEELIAINNFEKIADAFDCVKDKTCVCNIDLEPFSKDYKLKIEYFDGKKKLLLEDPDGKILSVKELGEINLCLMKSMNEKEDINEEVLFDWDRNGLLKPLRKLMKFTNLYKFNDNNICFITEETEDKDYFQNLKDCKTGKREARENAKNILLTFESKYRDCKSQEHKKDYCRCSYMGFEDLSEFYSIKVNQEKDTTLISLGYKTVLLKPPIAPEVKIENNIFGEFKRKWTGEEIVENKPEYVFDKDSKPIYFLRGKSDKEIFFAEESFGSTLESCSPTYVSPSWNDGNCGAVLPRTIHEVWERIETTKYGGRTYKQIIEESTKDKNLRILAAAVMAVESKAKNDVTSKTGCQGLMQFCGGTAKNFQVPCGGKTCYVCRPEGDNPCGDEDNRMVPDIAIPAGIKLIEEKMSYFKGPYKEIFGLAAYNGGQATIKAAILKTGKDNPDWETVKQHLTRNIIRDQIDPKKRIYRDNDDLDAKIKEISCYPYYVEEYRKAFEKNF